MYQKIIRVARRMVRKDPDDIAHDVWIVLRSKGVDDPPVWLIRCRVYDQLRKRRGEQQLVEDVVDVRETTQSDQLMDVNELVERAGLSDVEQMILYYRFVCDLSVEDVGVQVGMSRAKTTGVIKSVLERLRGMVVTS